MNCSVLSLNILTGSGAGNREAELITALQLLLDRLNSGNVPINNTVLEQLRKSGGGEGGAGVGLSSVNYTTSGGQVGLGITLYYLTLFHSGWQKLDGVFAIMNMGLNDYAKYCTAKFLQTFQCT